MRKFFCERDFKLISRTRLLCCYVFSTFPNFQTEHHKNFEAFEILFYRRILKISWTERTMFKGAYGDLSLSYFPV